CVSTARERTGLYTLSLHDALPILGGWEAPHMEIRGHTMGHYLSACALLYASTNDQEIKAKADAIIEELKKCQDALGSGYLSAFPDRKSTRLNSSHVKISYAVFCLK